MILFTKKYIVFLSAHGKTVAVNFAVSLLTAINLFCGNAAYSQIPPQLHRVTGIVTDLSTGETLIGATVKVQGRNNAIAVDVAGKFSILAPRANSVLVVSFTGYTEQQIPLEGKTVLDIKLSRVTTNLEDVIVQGFGLTTRKATLSGAVSTVSGEELSHSRAISASGALVGRTPGVNFRQVTGKPGQSPDLRIRNFGNPPLVVIDGVTRNTDAFNNLDFNDVESISVLKDGSAAIYGMQAADGVIVITTKKGKRGQKPTIGLESYYGTQKVVNFNKPADIKTYIKGIVQTETYGNGITSSQRTISKEEYDKWMNASDAAHQGFDWYKHIYLTAPQNSNKVSISGGSNNADYYVSVSNLKQEPMFRNFGDGFRRTNIQTNINATISKRIKAGVSINGNWNKTSNTNVPNDDYDVTSEGAFRNLPTLRPYANDNPLYPQISSPGDQTWSYGLVSPALSGIESTTRRTIQLNGNVEIAIVNGLKARVLASYAYSNTQFDSRRKSPTLYAYNPATGGYNVTFSTDSRNIEHIWTNAENTTTNVQLEYKRTFGKHNIQAIGGMETRIAFTPSVDVQATPPANNIAYIPNLASTWVKVIDDIGIPTMRHGYLGRLSYDYNGKYIAELSARYDGSPGYITGKRYGLFPGGSVGYRISNEDFWKHSSFLSKVNDFKLRASYGVLGNELGYNGYIDGYDYGNINNNGINTAVLNGVEVLGARARGLPSTYVTWGRTHSFNAGVDVQLLSNRLSGSFDYFKRTQKGLLAPRRDVFIPNLAGITISNENLNTDINRGIEGSLNWRDKIGQVSYFVGGNFTYSREITGFRYKQPFSSDYVRWRDPNNDEGRWKNGTFQLVSTGQFQSWEQIAKYPIDQDGKGNSTLRPGDFIFQDTNNDGFINDLDRQNVTYRVNGGTPYLNFAFNFGAGYKGFDFRMDFAGGSLFTYEQAGFMRLWENNQNTSQYLADHASWYTDIWDRNSEIKIGKYPLLIQGTPPPNAVLASTAWQINIIYAKLRNFELGYTLPYSVLNRVGMSNFRVYASGQNILAISNMPSGLDPEIVASGGNSYPNPRILTAGIQVKF